MSVDGLALVQQHSERRRKRTGDMSFERCCVTMHAENNCKICKVVECTEKLDVWTYSCEKEVCCCKATRMQWMHVGVGLTAMIEK